jgi:tight adherence protein G
MAPRLRGIVRHLSARRHDERGATFVLTAICMVLLLWGGAMGVDLGFTVDAGRQAQALADTASLDLARYLTIADSQSSLALSNSYLSGKLANVNTDNNTNITLTFAPGHWQLQSGKWQFTSENGPSGDCWNFTPRLTPACNAVMVTATQSAPQLFAGGSSSVSRSSIAELTPEGGFSIGSYLANMNTQQSAVLNALLGTLGTNANITAAGFAGMANTYVNLNQLIQASGSVLTSSTVMSTSLSGSQWLSILTNAVANQATGLSCGASPTPSPCVASSALSTMNFSSSTSASLCQLVSINGSSCGATPPTTAMLSTGLSVLQLLTTEAELANGTNAVDVTSALGITGVTSASLSLQLVQIPQVAFGPTGTTASTAQLAATLQFNVLGVGTINIPLSAAQATTALSSVSCSSSNTFQAAATNPTSTTTSTASVTLGGSQIATLTFAGVSNKSETFTAANVPPTASTFSSNKNPVQVGSASPAPSYSGLSSSSPAYSFLTTTLSGVMSPILQAVGVTVGGADVAFLGANCGAVSIVQ